MLKTNAKEKSSITTHRVQIQAAQHHPLKIQCTVTDHLVSNIPVTIGFFYPYQISKETLQSGLCKTLNDYPLFAGRLNKAESGLIINCDNQGLQFSAEDHNCDIETVLHTLLDDNPNFETFNIIDTSRVIEEQSAITTCKVNYYSDGTMSLGFCWHHILGDMHTFMHFLRAFSNTVSGKQISKPLITANRGEYLDQNIENTSPGQASIRYMNEEERAEFIQHMQTQAPNKKRIQFYFTNDELKALKQAYNENSDIPLSTNDALCAHMFSIMTACADEEKTRYLSIAINFRPRIPLSNDLLGNIISSVNIDVLPKQQPIHIANEIRNAINQYRECHLDYHANNEAVQTQGGMKSISQFVPKALDPIRGMFLVTNWSKFGVYEIDFGKAAPFYFTQKSSAPFPWMSSVIDGFDNNGLIFNSNLPTEVTQKLVEPEVLKQIHQYREPDDTLPKLAQRLPWIN